MRKVESVLLSHQEKTLKSANTELVSFLSLFAENVPVFWDVEWREVAQKYTCIN